MDSADLLQAVYGGRQRAIVRARSICVKAQALPTDVVLASAVGASGGNDLGGSKLQTRRLEDYFEVVGRILLD